MSSDDVVSELMHLGLNRSEARAYKVLASVGQSTARAVADSSGVPRSKVYEVLYSLEQRGLVRRAVGTSPTEFRAYEPRNAIPYLIEKLQNSGKSVLAELESLAMQKKAASEEFVWTEAGSDQIKLGTREAIARATKEVFIATRDPGLLSSLRPALADAKKRGVEIKLVSGGLSDQNLEEFKHYATIVDVTELSSRVLIDQLQKVLADETIETAGWDPNQISMVLIDNSESVAVFKPLQESARPWCLHVRSPLIAIFQRQVIVALLGAVERLLSGK